MFLLAATVTALTAAPAVMADTVVQYAAPVDAAVQYTVNGATSAALWGMGSQPGTQLLLFAFTDATPLPDNPSPPGPRLTFVVTQWAMGWNGWLQRQWYGNVLLDATTLAVNPDLGQGVLNVTIPGTLVERSWYGTSVHRDVPGQVQVRWTASSGVTNTSLSWNYQTPAYTTTVQTTGPGRLAMANATVTVDALGAPIQVWGFGYLSTVTNGVLSVTLQ